MKKNWNNNLIVIIVLFCGIILSNIFLFEHGVFNGIDTKYHMSRIIGITNSWKQGDLLAFIHLDSTGYGYAMGFFYSNLFMIFPCLLYLVGVDLFIVYKLFIVVSSIFTTISMYLCIKKITKSKYGATIGAFLYTTCSYRIITIILKGFIGEMLSFIFTPIILLGLYEIIYENHRKWWIFAIGFIGILNSNLVMTEIMIVVSGIIILLNIKRIIKEKNRIFSLFKSTIFSLLITSTFWMPMIEQLQNSEFEMKRLINVYNPSKSLIKLWQVYIGTVQYKKGLYSGACGMGIIFAFIMVFRIKIKENDNIIKFCNICMIIGLLGLIMVTDIFPWNSIKKIGGTIQFASRLEVVVSALFTIVCGIICSRIKSEDIKKVVFIAIIIWQTVASIICIKSCIDLMLEVCGTTNMYDIKVEENFAYNICDGVYLPYRANMYERQATFEKNINSEIVNTNNKDLKYNMDKKGLKITIQFENNNKEKTYIEIPMYYYYGYTAKSKEDGHLYKIIKGAKGKIVVIIGNTESDTIVIYYKSTKIQIISIIITIIMIILTICYIILKIKWSKDKKEKYPKYTTIKLKSKENKYSLCIPIYNEGERILNELKQANKTELVKYVDIVLLDGGSTDGTLKNQNLIRNNVNTVIQMTEKGIYRQSEALMAGFDFSIKNGYKGVITVDGNNKDSIENVKDFVKKLDEGYDYIQGSRFIKGGTHKNTPIKRYLAIKLIHAPIISITAHKKYTDTTNLFRGYSIKYINNQEVRIFRDVFKAYELSTYLSTRADQINLRTCEIPVQRDYPDNKKYSTKVGGIKGELKIIRNLIENMLGKYNI